MFDIRRRHTPMFVTSETRQLAQIMTEIHQLSDTAFEAIGLELLPVANTARINEHNDFVLKSFEKAKDMAVKAHASSLVKQQLDNPNSKWLNLLIEKLKYAIGIDSFIVLGPQTDLIIDTLLPEINADSAKPLVVFNSEDVVPLGQDIHRLMDLDHPAIWLEGGQNRNMSDVEAFFSIRSQFKIETSLNKFDSLPSFAPFSLGMVKF